MVATISDLEFMRILEATLKDVRKYSYRTFSFSPGFNLVVGENGAGKTTLLRSLEVVLGFKTKGGRLANFGSEDVALSAEGLEITAKILDSAGRVVELSYEKRLDRRPRRVRSEIQPLIVSYRSNEAVAENFVVKKIRKYALGDSQSAETGEAFLFEAQERIRSRAGHSLNFGHSWDVKSFVEDVLTQFSEKFRNFRWRFVPYRCSIHSHVDYQGDAVTPFEKEPFKSIRRNLAFSIMRYFQEKGNPFKNLDQTSVVVDSSGFILGRPTLGRALPSFQELLEGSKNDMSDLSRVDSWVAEIGLTPRIEINTDEGEYTIDQLSDGEKRLFSIFVDIARQIYLRDAQVANEKVSAIVLIDEIDVHLHPRWQRRIVPALERLFPECQFIATTHSPFVIQAVDRSKVRSTETEGPIRLDQSANSIEDIVEGIQEVDMPQRSMRAERLSETAERYFKLLKKYGDVSLPELRHAEQAYREASEPFSSDPALSALLKIESREHRGR